MSWFYIGAAAVSVISALDSADAQRRAAHTNADIAKQKANIARDQANVNEDAQRRRAAIAIGRSRAAAAQSGTGLDGTNADLLEQSSSEAELDALNIRYSGKIGELSNTEQAGLFDMQADDAMTAGWLNAAAGALSAYGGYVRGGGSLSGYSYNDDAAGGKFSGSGDAIRGRR